MTKFIELFKKPLDSVSDEITTNFKTSFFSAYLVVWLIRNNLFHIEKPPSLTVVMF